MAKGGLPAELEGLPKLKLGVCKAAEPDPLALFSVAVAGVGCVAPKVNGIAVAAPTP